VFEEVRLDWVDELCVYSRGGMGPCFIKLAQKFREDGAK